MATKHQARRHLWGVDLNRDGALLFTGWLRPRSLLGYAGEPTRPLLFCTREIARRWCYDQHAFYRTYPEGHVCRAWRFRAVRVRETLEITDAD